MSYRVEQLDYKDRARQCQPPYRELGELGEIQKETVIDTPSLVRIGVPRERWQ
jgi:hypothetical protein